MGYVFYQIFHDFTIITTKENYVFLALCEKIISSVLIGCWVPVASTSTTLCFDLIRDKNVLIFSKLQLLICLSAHSCARSSVRLSIEPESTQSSQDSRHRLLTVLRGLVIFFSVNKQLTEHQHHGMVVGNQHSHNTKVCDKSWKENDENLKGGSKVVQDPLGYALVNTMITL